MNQLFDIKFALLPETIITFFILLCCILTFMLKGKNQKLIYQIATSGVILALASFATINIYNEYSAFWGSFTSNTYTIMFRILILLGSLLAIQLSKSFTSKFSDSIGEFYTLILTATLGAMLLAGANDMIMLFVALETLSLSSYVLVGYAKCDRLTNEAAMKYLIIGGASSAVMLLGFSFLYGITGETNLFEISGFLVRYNPNLLLILSFIFILGGFSFKLSAFPFYNWTPDVYEGAPVPVTAFLSVVSKTAGFAIAIRFLTLIFANIPVWTSAIATIALITITIGNLVAIKQTNIRRLLAYSSISQAGYVLLGLSVLTNAGISAMIFYLFTYLFMNFGVWAAVELYANQTGKDSIDDYRGLAFKQPYLAAGLTICVLSLAGIPVTAGFFSKFYLFQSIFLAGFDYVWILLIALINTLIAVFYYLRIVKSIFTLLPATERVEKVKTSRSLSMVLTITTVAVLVLGVLSSPFISLSRMAASGINLPIKGAPSNR